MTTFSFCFFQKTLLKNCYHDIVSIYQRESCSAAKSQHLSILRLDFVHFLLVAKMSKITVTKVRWLVMATWPECPRKFGEVVLLAILTGKRYRGRPRTRWCDSVLELDGSRLGVEPAELSDAAENCDTFWDLLGLLPPRPCWEEKQVWKLSEETSYWSMHYFYKVIIAQNTALH